MIQKAEIDFLKNFSFGGGIGLINKKQNKHMLTNYPVNNLWITCG